MWTRLIATIASRAARRSSRSNASASARRKPQRLQLEALEAREVPAVTIQLDYSYDTNGFFNDPSRRAVLQQAVNDVAGNLNANLPAIVPGGGNSWSETFFNPANGQQVSIGNPIVNGNTLVIYVGGRPIGGSEAGFGGSGGYSASGSQAWLNSLTSRGPSGSLLWGGSITFDTTTNWFVGSTTDGLNSNQVDLLSVAEHELGHVLGIGTSPRWFSLSSGGRFFGGNAGAVYGGAVPESPDGAHWAHGITVNGVHASLDPMLSMGTRVTFSSLDFAGLADLGWSASLTPPQPVISPNPLSTAPVPVGSSLLREHGGSFNLVAVSGPTDGSTQIFTMGSGGELAPAGPRFVPFPGFNGIVRATIADFDGDGIADFAFGTGAGVGATVRIISGATGTDMVGPTGIFSGFSGGLFLAGGDVNGDGKAELAISADIGGGPRVTVFKVQNGQLIDALDFTAFSDPSFRGGTRVALADVNRDGVDDLIVGAGVGGGPRVSVYDGNGLLSGRLNKLIPDFFALDPSLRSGVFVTSADINGDGYSDVIYSTGNTGGPRIRIVSGALLMANPGADVSQLPALADFFALNSADRNGIRIAAHDLDGDGKAELIVGSGAKYNPSLRVIPLSQMNNNPTNPVYNPFGDPTSIDGLYVG